MEGTDLTTAQTGGQFQQEQFEAAVLFGLDEQPLDLFRGENLHFSGFCRGEAAEVGGIFGDDLLGDCLVQRRVEGGVDAADSLVGKSFAVLFLTKQTAILFEPGVELLDVAGGEFVQRNGAQVRDDMLIDPPFIGHLGVGAKVWLFTGLIPEVQPLGGCHGLLR